MAIFFYFIVSFSVLLLSNSIASFKHFDEKLLLLKNLMNTSEGKKMAEGRHEYMQAFIAEIYEEIGDECSHFLH